MIEKFQYNIDNIYNIVAKYYQIESNELILTAGCDIALRTFYESLQREKNVDFHVKLR